MALGGNGVPVRPPAHRPRQPQSVSLSPLIKYRATNYFPLMFLLNMGGHNYCSFCLPSPAASRWESHTHAHICVQTPKHNPATWVLVISDQLYIQLLWISICFEWHMNSSNMCFHEWRHIIIKAVGDCISCLTTSGGKFSPALL